MNLTIIFGNGFDKNLGLNTTYPDFYSWLDENQKKESDEIYCNIKEKPENWSDLELALGKYTFDNEIMPDKFEESYENLIEDLNEYLLLEQGKLGTEFSIGDSITELFYSIEKNLVETGQNKNSQIIRRYLSQPTDVNFVTFNYTDTLEKTMGYKKFVVNKGVNQVLVKLHSPIHVHGTLNSSMVLGVNDETQFKSEIFDNEFPEFFVKNKNLTDHVNSTELDKALEVIFSSEVLFLFGVSLGDTDKVYWEKIAEWLLYGGDDHIVLLYDYETPMGSISKVVQRRMERSWNNTKDKFLKQSGLSSDDQKRISKQIFPLYGNGFFNIEEAQKN
ncbi:AbiH family protein [Lactococcus lactis]|uniref:AbiH family protein n=1 Tax=Lactococcus lactis TaxID=1358 RepID=UPI00241734E8|nr:AbiH family protein [Lactococcus lactis]MDG4956788.1 bacteriophage abortive infection AbiH family protein [Lactococcus lactis]